jgi:hypothetical protein
MTRINLLKANLEDPLHPPDQRLESAATAGDSLVAKSSNCRRGMLKSTI